MQKKQFKIIRRVLFYLPLILVACLVCYLWLFESYDINQEKLQRAKLSVNSKYSLSSFLLSPNKDELFNRKTPRGLFAKFINENVIMWSGYFGDCFQAFDCITSGKYNHNDNDELERNLKKCQMLMLLLDQTKFQYSEIPLSTSENTLALTLAYKDYKNKYYIEKGKDGNWFFTEENFKNPKIIKLYNDFKKKFKKRFKTSLISTSPLAAYVNFMLGFMEKYDFTLNNATNVLGLNKVPKIIRKKYSRFIAFILFKVLTTKNIGFTTITSESLFPTSNILYVKPGVGTISMEKKLINNETGVYKWIFPAKTLRVAYTIYANNLMITAPNDPLFFKIQHWFFVHFNFMENKLFGIKYQNLIIFLFSIYLLFLVYKLFRKTIEAILNLAVITKQNYQIYAKRFSIYSALLIVLFVYDSLFNTTLMLYYELYIYYAYATTILYMIIFICWLCEILNIISSIVVFILERKGSKVFRAVFVIDIIRRICSILIVIILFGMLLNKLGVNMLNFLTALGIGGLAVAFAGKDTIENLFGSIMIAIEKPFKLGDWIIIGGEFEGVAEHVGLRSTRIRTFEDSYLTVPNVKFITSSVNNMGERTYRRYSTTLDLEDSTPTELIKSFTAGITELIMETPCMKKKEFHIRVNDIGESSVKVMIYVFFVTLDWADELKERERFILNILRLAEELGVKFAYPTQTLLLSKFKGTDNKQLSTSDFKSMNKSTFKAEKTARKIIEKFKLKTPKDPSKHDH